ncbi:hypothetical protein JCM11251_005689 [Rhodosporidiobolus azoricus]
MSVRTAGAAGPPQLGNSAGLAGSTGRNDQPQGGRRSLPPPIVTDFAVDSSPGKPAHRHTRYKHHEPAPRRFFKRLNSLFHPTFSSPASPSTSPGDGKKEKKHHKHSYSLPASLVGSSSSLARGDHPASSCLPRSPLVAEPESLPLPPQATAFSAVRAPGTGYGPNERLRPNLKIRICTFNMHDSLPSIDGDLSEFLGDVGAFPQEFMRHPRTKKRMSSFGGRSGHSNVTATSRTGSVLGLPISKSRSFSLGSSPSDTDPDALPAFPLNEGHPYHVLVVCGQECPTASGVLAGKVRTLDGKGWTSILENYLCGGCDEGDEGREESGSESESGASSEGEGDIAKGEEGEEGEDLEESATARRTDSHPPPTPSTVVAPPSLSARHRATSVSASASTSRAPSALGSHRQPHRRPRGPYVLVEKERLLGIYCAVFVARCCEDLVEGVSKGRVTAGLIGGRVGNKGGVGISLLFASHRLLFISAHLAAHASGLEIRKANALKILEEMDVDDFWEQSGKVGPKPRELSERFDQTFFMGDLNFRLSISRLHADWLFRGKDIATALRFDQLKAVLAEANGVFKGFSEGDIKFPPSYKYDLPLKSRIRKRRSTILGSRKAKKGGRGGRDRAGSVAKNSVLDFSVAEAEAASASGSLTDPEVSHSTSSAARNDEDDSLSIISSVGTISTLSLSLIPSNTPGSPTTSGTSYAFDPLVTRSPASVPKASLTSLGLPAPPMKGNETSMDAVRKAQVRFLTLVKSNSAAAAIQHAQDKALALEGNEEDARKMTKDSRNRLSSLFPPRPILQASQSAVVLPSSPSLPSGFLSSSPMPSGGESSADEETAATRTGDAGEATFAAKFDSSAKQRVQSYTDRILFKSTVIPPPSSPASDQGIEEEETEGDPDSEDGEHHTTANGFDLRSRRSTNFATALRRGLTRQSSSASSSSSGSDSDSGNCRRLRFGRTKSLQPRSTSMSRCGSTGGESTKTSGSAETHPPPNQAGGEGAEGGAAPSFWKRVRSLKDLASLPSATSVGSAGTDVSAGRGQGGSAPASIASPLQSPGLSTTASTSTTPTVALPPPVSVSNSPLHPPHRRTPRKTFTLSSPPSSPEESRAPSLASGRPRLSQSVSDTLAPAATSNITAADPPPTTEERPRLTTPSGPHVAFPRALTQPAGPATAAGSSSRSSHRAVNSEHSHSASSASLNTRFKSFLNLLPFLSSASIVSLPHGARSITKEKSPINPKIIKVGPREGEVQVMKYDAVRDLKKMGAVSDHLPVFGVFAVGLGKPKKVEEDEDEHE